ncbi:MAG: hypothetical protein KZQ63_02805 [Candidatus Thiodiazotropha sp. (ex Lucinoma aequizonata)]|nr:hypothetical protein [Candidatus Thiodiazotropha sp. (ex Lucinoma aequizonata)]
MRSLYAFHLSLSVAIPVIQPRLRLSGTNRLCSAFHGGQRRNGLSVRFRSVGLQTPTPTRQQRPRRAYLNIQGFDDHACIRILTRVSRIACYPAFMS